jgi:hypothetical protein
MYIYVFFFLFPETTENTEPSIHVHVCFLLFCCRNILRIQNTEHSILCSVFCILSILCKQKDENIDVYVYRVLYSQYALEAERRKHICTCILGFQNPAYMCIYLFFYLFPEKTENTEPSIHVHLCFLLSVSREYWEYRTQNTFTSMFS